MLVLSQRDVEHLLPMGECIDVMASTLAALAGGDAILPLRTVIRIPDGGDAFAVMPAYINAPKTIGAKIVTVFPGNHGTKLDSHQGAVLLFDKTDGTLAALVDGTAVTTIRTAAVSAVATLHLSRPESATLAILGAGVQARSHLEAMCSIRPITSVRIWSRNTAKAQELAAHARRAFHLEATVSAARRDAVETADIVCTTTSANEPVLNGDWLRPGTHINAVGACTPSARELDTKAVVRSRLYVDRRESALKEPGDILVPLEEKAITPEHIVAELGEVLVGLADARNNETEITLFKSLGLAIEDLAAAAHVLAGAQQNRVGLNVNFGGARRGSP